MPKYILKHCCIADVLQDEQPKEGFDGKPLDKVVVLNCNEEDFFDMLDHVNPKNIIKYLDMRGIPHREAIKITVKRIEIENREGVDTHIKNLIKTNNKHVNRANELMEKYYG